ncbi:MAG: hypothetical protein P8165_02460 [Deltaproteobacteria bacterium]
MKLVSPEQIKKAEADLINSIRSSLNWDAVKAIFRERHHLELGEVMRTKGAEIRIANDRMRYVLDLEVNLNLSIELDREGDFLSIQAGQARTEKSEDVAANVSAEPVVAGDMDADSDETSETVAFGGEEADAEIDMEKWLEEGDQGGAEQIYEDALIELGSIDRP